MSISLVVGGIGIMNVLLSSVIERTREIGIRKATGAAQRHILWQLLCESVAITTVVAAIGASVVIGRTFGLYPAMRAARLSPIDAIHHE
jgi:putative ABC transport system permease protein